MEDSDAKSSLLRQSTLRVQTPSLPDELLASIFVMIEEVSTYEQLFSVCRRFYAIANDPIVRHRFAEAWFASHCNDQPRKSPSLIEYAARYLKRHCLLPYPGCFIKYNAMDERYGAPFPDGPHLASSPTEFPTDWWYILFRGFDVFEPSKQEWFEMMVSRIREKVERERKGLTFDGWTLEDVQLDLEDVVFADALCRIYHDIEENKHAESDDDDVDSDKDDPLYYHDYLGGVEMMRDELICICGKAENF